MADFVTTHQLTHQASLKMIAAGGEGRRAWLQGQSRGGLPKLPPDRFPDDGRCSALLDHQHAEESDHRGLATPADRLRAGRKCTQHVPADGRFHQRARAAFRSKSMAKSSARSQPAARRSNRMWKWRRRRSRRSVRKSARPAMNFALAQSGGKSRDKTHTTMVIASRRQSQRLLSLPNKSGHQGQSRSALDVPICSENRVAVAIDGFCRTLL